MCVAYHFIVKLRKVLLNIGRPQQRFSVVARRSVLAIAVLWTQLGFAQSTSDSPLLWKGSNFPIYYNRTAFDRYNMDRTFLVPWLPYAGYVVPDPVSWGISPFNNITWEMYFHSLTWLYSDAFGYDSFGDEAYIADAQKVILSWITDNPNPPAANRTSWDDHATAFRSSVLTYFYKRYLATRMTAVEDSAYRQSFELHAQKLEQFFNAHLGDGYNHDLMSAQALLNMGVNLPGFSAAPLWRSRAMARIDALVFEVFDVQEAINREQSLAYQIWDINMFRDTWKYLVSINQPSPFLTAGFLQQSVDFAATAMTPSGRVPAIGDTDYGMQGKAAIEAYRADGLVGSLAEFMLSEGASGLRPADMVVYPRQGYVLMRPSYGESRAWRDDLHIILKAGPARRVHGHHDWGSFTLSAFGEELLVDSGGPYLYGDPLREAFMSAFSHNVVVVDERDYSADRGALITRSVDDVQMSFAEIKHESIVGYRHKRAFILLKPETLVIVDRLDAQDSAVHRLDLLFHLAPGTSVTADGNRIAANIGDARLEMEVFGSTPVSLDVVSGQTAPYLLGWVTPAYGKKIEAPVARYTGQGTDEWFVTVARVGGVAQSPAFDASVAQVAAGNWLIEIADEAGLHRSALAFSDSSVSVRADLDGDGLWDDQEMTGCTSHVDVDSDDDGLGDGEEDVNGNGAVDPIETDPCNSDTDGDGVADGTESGRGLPIADPDGVGSISGTNPALFVPDADPSTVTSPVRQDTDGDGYADGAEDANRNGRLDTGESDPASAASTPTPDTDGDGLGDSLDNCLLTANANQLDSDEDGYGNRCDPDFTNNGIVDSQDGALLKSAFGSSGFPNRDLNGNGIVDSQDGAILKSMFGKPPGPSGLACAGTVPCPVAQR